MALPQDLPCMMHSTITLECIRDHNGGDYSLPQTPERFCTSVFIAHNRSSIGTFLQLRLPLTNLWPNTCTVNVSLP